MAAILTSDSVQEQFANATNRVGVPKLALHTLWYKYIHRKRSA